MPGRSCYFYADEDDLSCLLESFRDLIGYKYVQITSGINENSLVIDDPVELLNLAMVTPEKPLRTHSFLIFESDHEVVSRDIELRDGRGVIRIIDQNNNFDSIVIAFGGNAGNKTILMSDINTVGDTAKSIEMHNKFKKLVASKTKRVGAKGKPYHLMHGAAQKLISGWHLTQNRAWEPGIEEIVLSDDEKKIV